MNIDQMSIEERIKRALAHQGCTDVLNMKIPQAPAPKWDEKQRQAFLDRLPACMEDVALIMLTDPIINKMQQDGEWPL